MAEQANSSVEFLRDKMKKADFKLVDLAEFLDISRPTAYKFIELYEQGQRDKLDEKVLRLFKFIDTNKSKIEIINYIAGMKQSAQSTLKRRDLIANLLEKESKVKIDFIDLLTQSELYDPILEYLLECAKIASKPKPSQKEVKCLAPLRNFYHSLELKLNIKESK